MCIAALVKPGFTIVKKRLKAMADNNSDGQGFAGINTDHLGRKKMITYKSMNFNKFYKKFRRFQRLNPESPCLVHMRIGTSGTLSSFNCHPFSVNKNLCFIHNGIITKARRDPDGKKNDTQMMNEDILKGLPKDFIFNSGIMEMLSEYIGMSKLVFLDIKGNYAFANESKGEWLDDVWYSNSSYKPRTWYKNYNTTYVPPKKVQPKVTKRATDITADSFIECDYCGTFTKTSLLRPYRSFGFMETFCASCERMLISSGSILAGNKKTTTEYVEAFNDGECATNVSQVM